jgi:hypothetical protein
VRKFPATNAVVAICVLLLDPLGVGAVGVPVKAGEFKGAYPPLAGVAVFIFPRPSEYIVWTPVDKFVDDEPETADTVML